MVEAIARELKSYLCCDSKKYVHKEPEEVLTKNISEKKQDKERKVLFPKRLLKEIRIQKLKGINNLCLKFDKNLVALMGVNGSGKSTVLHALACSYSPYEKGENYKFSYFLHRIPDASWKGSCFTIVNYDLNEKKEVSKKFEKKGDRWARYDSRLKETSISWEFLRVFQKSR